MSIWTLVLVLAFVAMIAMHLRGHGVGHGHRRDDGHDHGPDAPDARDAEDPRQPAGTTGSHGGHRAHCH